MEILKVLQFCASKCTRTMTWVTSSYCRTTRHSLAQRLLRFSVWFCIQKLLLLWWKHLKFFFLNCFKIKFKLSRHTVSFHHLEKLAENTYSDLRALQSLKFPREYAYWVLCPTGSKCVDSARPGDLGGHSDVTMLGNVLGRNPKGMAMAWKLWKVTHGTI